jgi:hypothetical protein
VADLPDLEDRGTPLRKKRVLTDEAVGPPRSVSERKAVDRAILSSAPEVGAGEKNERAVRSWAGIQPKLVAAALIAAGKLVPARVGAEHVRARHGASCPRDPVDGDAFAAPDPLGELVEGDQRHIGARLHGLDRGIHVGRIRRLQIRSPFAAALENLLRAAAREQEPENEAGDSGSGAHELFYGLPGRTGLGLVELRKPASGR